MADVAALDDKVRDLCWDPKNDRLSLDAAASELTAWSQANGWAGMTANAARELITTEANTQRLKPVPATSPRAAEIADLLRRVREANGMAPSQTVAERQVQALFAAGWLRDEPNA